MVALVTSFSFVNNFILNIFIKVVMLLNKTSQFAGFFILYLYVKKNNIYMNRNLLTVILFFSLFISSVYSLSKEKLIIGTKLAEPFVIENNKGEFKGISFELWNRIAAELNVDSEVKVYSLDGLLKAVENSEVDIAVSPLTITADREKLFDFTHSYFTTGLSIAVSNTGKSNLFSVFKNIFSSQFISIILFIFFILFLVGFLVWLFERNKNKDQFGDGLTKGLGSSFWWAAVTMTTVGYGDKAPQTTGGRIIALIWMFAGLIMISSFTAAIASALTVDSLDNRINKLSDLYNVKVGTVKNSSSEDYLNENGITFITTKNIQEGIKDVSENKIDAFVYDAPILKYYIKSQNIADKISVLPIVLNPIHYGFALPQKSKLREPINRILLKEINNREWKKIVNSYLGKTN